MRRGLWSAALAALLAACGGGGGGGEEPVPPPAAGGRMTAAHVPLATGYRWSYRDQLDALSTEAVVAGRSGTEGQRWTLQAYTAPEEVSAGEVEMLPDRLRYLPPASDSLATAVGAYDLMRFPMVPGDRYTAVDRAVDWDVDGDGRQDRVRATIVVELLGVGPHEIPLGRFDEVAQLRTTVDLRVDYAGAPLVESTLVLTEWRAPGIGLIQRDKRLTSEGYVPRNTSEKLVAWRSAAGRSESVAPSLATAAPQGTRAPRWDVRLAFSEVMDPLALRLASIELRRLDDGSVVPGRREAGVTTLAWRQDAVLAAGDYEARVVGGELLDLAGNAVQVPPWRFRIDPLASPFAAASPAPEATEVPLDSVLSFTFDERPDPATLAAGVVLSDANRGAVPVALTLDGAVLSVRPTQPLQRGQRYTLLLDSLLRDRDGHSLFPTGASLAFHTDAGRFRHPLGLPTPSNVSGLQLGDVDGDGRLDILVQGNDSAGVYNGFVLLRQQDGLSFERSVLMSDLLDCTTRVAIVGQFLLQDLDGDRRPELVRRASGCGIEVLAREADGRWSRRAWVAEPDAAWMGTADLDGDGRAELLVAIGTSVQVWAFGTAGDAVLSASVDFPDEPGGAGWVSAAGLAAPDLDGDGRPDLLLLRSGPADRGAGALWRLRRPDGSLGPVQRRAFALSFGPYSGHVVADLDGDGRQDLAIASPGDRPFEVTVLRQVQDGGLGAPEALATFQWGTQLVAADLDGDGRAELVTGHPDNALIGVHAGLGPSTSYPALRWGIGFAAGDLDGDGLVDLVTGNAVLLQKR